MKYYVTNEKVRFEERETSLEHHPKAEMNLVKVYTDIEEQEIKGFGGALTEASAWVVRTDEPAEAGGAFGSVFRGEGKPVYNGAPAYPKL